jgi:uncharacterized oligopeptide transporter (OPT) family protein
MAITRWWQLAIGAALGAALAIYLTAAAFMIAIVVGLLLAWASLRSDGDDALTASAAGYLTGVLGYGLIHVSAIVFNTPFA